MILSRIRTENLSHLPRQLTSQLPAQASVLVLKLPQHEQPTPSAVEEAVDAADAEAALETRVV